ncbi:MAG: 5-methyltetrahydropteroyltriglutamate--homocysteine S-methyltransferase [Alphaproteobacteria bacterium]|nr:5-methyltetrahydropteroyltriglutamate--homocysteine S-methyltransferase [Alphaproteobacteria bacterium]MDP6517115.1 5-methyltetrahydropteroyltriglutamate--homocysteine S-methyltransferase [Alphaproteobacteria bacterium]
MTDQTEPGPPFRAEHLGSLLRPRALKDAHRARAAGTLSEDGYQGALDRAVGDAVALQESVGLEVITDGEFRRSSWFSGFFEALDGFTLADSRFAFHDAAGSEHHFRTCRATAPVRRRGGIAIEEFLHVRGLTTHIPKVTIPSPSAFHFFRLGDCADPAVYPDIAAFWEDLVAAYRAEIAELGARGAQYLQIDEVPLAMLCDEAVRDQARGLGARPEALIDSYIDLVNRVLAGRPEGMVVAMHLCRGNFRSRWLAAGGYEPIAERLFNDLAVDAFFLEYDTPRAGGFEPLRLMAADKRVVLGLISTKTPELDSADGIRRRIDAAARHIPLARLGLSPQCGFASVAGGNALGPDDQRRKLALVVEVADAVWG